MIARLAIKTATVARVVLLTAGLGLASLASAIPLVSAVDRFGFPTDLFAPVPATTTFSSPDSTIVYYWASNLGVQSESYGLGLDNRKSLDVGADFKVVSVQGPAGVKVTLDSAMLMVANANAGRPAMLALGFRVTTPDFLYGASQLEVTLKNARTGQQTVIGLSAINN